MTCQGLLDIPVKVEKTAKCIVRSVMAAISRRLLQPTESAIYDRLLLRQWCLYGTIICLMFVSTITVAQGAGEFQLSYSCVNCHKDRYDEWSRSMHALAVSDPIFEAEYMRAFQSDPKYRSYCLTCHSPTTRITNDFNLAKSISVEGITCSFCHTVTAVNGNNYTFNQSNPMQGPYKDSMTDAHLSSYSELHTKSELCAGCHDFSINGVPISQTYTEWKQGPYAAEGKQCQDCHMATKSGVAAENGTLRDKVYQHFWYGGHTGQFLQNAFHIESAVQRTGNRFKVTLNITNNNVGHMIPSGLPSRKVVLDFNASDEKGQAIFSGQKVYSKTLIDQYGNEVSDFWKAVSIAKDNRFKPRESRIETFEFDVPNGTVKLNTQAILTYQLETEIVTIEPESINVELANVANTTQLETPASATPKMSGPGPIGSIAAMTAAVLLLWRRKRDIK